MTASNLLANHTVALRKPFYVQIPPANLQLHLEDNFVQFGKVSTFRAAVTAGTDVHYNWYMGDLTDYIDAGKGVFIVNHGFDRG